MGACGSAPATVLPPPAAETFIIDTLASIAVACLVGMLGQAPATAAA